MKLRPLIALSMLLLLTCTLQAGAVTFATKRLAGMATYLNLQQLDTLKMGTCEQYSYQGRTLVVRVNNWGEVEHIGLKLFPYAYRSLSPSPVYDFLERYLLELNASPRNTESGAKLAWDKVHFSVGNAATALQIDSTAAFIDNHIDLKVYQVSWLVNNQVKLQLSFDMDYQLLTGCTEIELEQNFMRNLQRFTTHPMESNASLPDEGDEYIQQRGFFITPKVCANRYYSRIGDQWQLTATAKRPTQSIANIMLNEQGNEHVKLNLVIDQYGYKLDSLETSYLAFLQMCIDEGCQAYFGMKNKETDAYTGTVFLVNRKAGYLHLLSVRVPQLLLTAPDQTTIAGRLFAYIPLFNVSNRILNPQDYQPINE